MAHTSSTRTLLLVGCGLVFMTFMRYSLAEIAWLVLAPSLVALHASGSVRRHRAVLVVLTVAATSIASDQYGRLLASRRADSQDDGVMMAAVPTRRVPTLYTRTGEVVPVAALLFCAFVFARLPGARRASATQG